MNRDINRATSLLKQRLRSDWSAGLEKNLEAKDSVQSTFGLVFAPENLSDLSREDVKEFLSHDVNLHWSGLHRNQSILLEDMDRFRSQMSVLLDEDRSIAERYNEAVQAVPGLGKGTATAILHVTYPEHYGVWNGKSEAALESLRLMPTSQGSEGEMYRAINQVLVHLAEELEIDLWTLDLLWEDVARRSISEAQMSLDFQKQIPHLKRTGQSSFYHDCRAAIESRTDPSAPTPPIHVAFEAGADGYPGDVWVQIQREDEDTFLTDWDGSDPPRFPARIRAATTAIRDAGRRGHFRIWHEKSDLVILPNEYLHVSPWNLIDSGEGDTDAPGENETYREGRAATYEATRYERSRAARKACIDHHGAQCAVCNFDFGARYGDRFDGLSCSPRHPDRRYRGQIRG
jgi:hypothetical protein